MLTRERGGALRRRERRRDIYRAEGGKKGWWDEGSSVVGWGREEMRGILGRKRQVKWERGDEIVICDFPVSYLLIMISLSQWLASTARRPAECLEFESVLILQSHASLPHQKPNSPAAIFGKPGGFIYPWIYIILKIDKRRSSFEIRLLVF